MVIQAGCLPSPPFPDLARSSVSQSGPNDWHPSRLDRIDKSNVTNTVARPRMTADSLTFGLFSPPHSTINRLSESPHQAGDRLLYETVYG